MDLQIDGKLALGAAIAAALVAFGASPLSAATNGSALRVGGVVRSILRERFDAGGRT